MSESFRELLRRVRAGDEQATTELVQTYAQAIRVHVRVRLTDPRLRRMFDSSDICQSVMTKFVFCARLGRYELDTPEQLRNLLITMAVNRVQKHADREQTQKRDCRRVEHSTKAEPPIIDPGESPSQIVALRELEEKAQNLFTPEELWIREQIRAGRGWLEIGAGLGKSAAAVRMQYDRAVDRLTRQLGLENE